MSFCFVVSSRSLTPHLSCVLRCVLVDLVFFVPYFSLILFKLLALLPFSLLSFSFPSLILLSHSGYHTSHILEHSTGCVLPPECSGISYDSRTDSDHFPVPYLSLGVCSSDRLFVVR